MFWLVSNRSYPCNVGVVTTEKAMRKAWEKYVHTGEEWPVELDHKKGGWTVQFFPDKWHPTYIIWVAADLKTTKDHSLAGIVAHECTHIAQYLWKQIGEDEPGTEAEAYLIGNMTEEILGRLWKNR